MKELLVRNKDNRLKLELRRQHNWKWPEQSNKWRSRRCFKSKPELKRQNSSQRFASRDKSGNLNKSWSTRGRNCWKDTLWSLRSRSLRRGISLSKKGSRGKSRTKRPNSCTRRKRGFWRGLNNRRLNSLRSWTSHKSISCSLRRRRSAEEREFSLWWFHYFLI